MVQAGIRPIQKQTLGKFIRARRLTLGMTQEQLAERVGVGVRQADISRLEGDKIDLPRRDRMEAIASALGVTLGDLLIATGWLEIEHAAMIEQINDDTEPDPDVLADAMAVLAASKELVINAAQMLDRAETHVASIAAATSARNHGRPRETAA